MSCTYLARHLQETIHGCCTIASRSSITCYSEYVQLLTLTLVLLAGTAAADEPRFDLAVTDAPARAFFDGLVDGTQYNMVLNPGTRFPSP
jgi:hypothetical protein